MQNFGLLIARVKFHQIYTLIVSFCWKNIQFQLKKYRGVTSHDSEWRVMQILNKNQFVVSKVTKVWWILIWALKSLKNFYFDWFLLCKVYSVWPKKIQRSYLSWLWRVKQNWRKTDLWSGKWHEEFGKFLPEHLKVSKIGTLMGSFSPE